MNNNENSTEIPMVTLRIGEKIHFSGEKNKNHNNDTDSVDLKIKIEEFLERLS